jgi:D-alanyl-lipoteichoic acid acyltransferase DltB (MBOAT superfamily)
VTFNSLQYAGFLPLVLIIYWRLHRREQNLLLLVASYVFYGLFDWRFVGLLIISTMTDYTVGRLLEHMENQRRRTQTFVISLVVNLGILGFFKYFDFFTNEGQAFLGHLGLHVAPPVLRVLLPIGISFYTFHGISYSFDVYRRTVKPTHDLVAFAVFVAFFPQLVAGPIGRAHLQLPQFERDRVFPDRREILEALFLILLGLFKKIVLADTLAPFVDATFSNPSAPGSVTLILGAWAFIFQIYLDFSGYSDIARGSAKLLGIDLPVNFNQPFLSRSITELWRRWHISLSTWLRDYLYIPLGGNEGSDLATYRNILITFALGGLWHGAAMTFVVFGVSQGVFLVLERRYRPGSRDDYARNWKWPSDLLRVMVTFELFVFGGVFFRSPNVSSAVHYLGGIVDLRGGPVDRHFVLTLVCVAGLATLIDVIQRTAHTHVSITHWRPSMQGVTYGLMLAAIVLFSGETPVPFYYFRF